MPPTTLLMILTENHTLVDPRDLDGLTWLAVEAEKAGFGAVMASEHVALTSVSGRDGRPTNPRDYAAPFLQDPSMTWPSSNLLMAAISSVTSSVRLVLGAIIAPLRHPVLLAKELATLDLLSHGRLVVQPTVSWEPGEYRALGVPFQQRGAILDEQLDAIAQLWGESPAQYHGNHFDFEDVYIEPKPYESRPTMWFGGQHLHPRLLDRLVRYGDGFHPFGRPSDADLETIRTAFAEAGRDPNALELIGGTTATFDDPDAVADVDRAMASFPEQIERGFTTFCMKPSQFTDSVDEVPALCNYMVDHLRSLTGLERLAHSHDAARDASVDATGPHATPDRDSKVHTALELE